MTQIALPGRPRRPDSSASLSLTSKLCHPERRSSAAADDRVEGPAVASPLVPSPLPTPCRTSPRNFDAGDKLHEECGVVAIYGHPHAAREAYLASTPCSIAARNPPASPPPTVRISPTSKAWAWFRKSSRTTFSPSSPATWPSATHATPLPATRRCSTRSPFASTPPRASSPSRTTATW
jgi:hypothetical protein